MFWMKQHPSSVVQWEIKWSYAISSVTEWDMTWIIKDEGENRTKTHRLKKIKLFKVRKETNYYHYYHYPYHYYYNYHYIIVIIIKTLPESRAMRKVVWSIGTHHKKDKLQRWSQISQSVINQYIMSLFNSFVQLANWTFLDILWCNFLLCSRRRLE